MKKTLLLLGVAVCLMATAVMAQNRSKSNGNNNNNRSGKCIYSPLQDVVREAKGAEIIQKLADSGVDFNVPQRCGGTILQLAIQRGNPDILKALLEAGTDATKSVSLDGFTIMGAPKEIPLMAFAAYYAPRQDMVQMLVTAGAKVTELDSNGQTILWYMDQNPILRKTDLEDEITSILLVAKPEMMVNAKNPVSTIQGAKTQPKTPVMQKVEDPRLPAQAPQAALLTKTGKDTIGYKTPVENANEGQGLPAGTVVIQRNGAYPAREIVEPDMPVK